MPTSSGWGSWTISPPRQTAEWFSPDRLVPPSIHHVVGFQAAQGRRRLRCDDSRQ